MRPLPYVLQWLAGPPGRGSYSATLRSVPATGNSAYRPTNYLSSETRHAKLTPGVGPGAGTEARRRGAACEKFCALIAARRPPS